MLSAVKVIGACLIIMLAIFGLIAIVLMLIVRVRDLFKAVRPYGRTRSGAKIDLRAVVADARARPGRFLLCSAIIGAIALFPLYVLLGLIALGAIAAVHSVLAKWRGWGSEGRLTRHLSRPPFTDESRRVAMSPGSQGEATPR